MANYFELYEIPESFAPDAATVKRRFYELSRQYHPDRLMKADEVSEADALQMSALVNDAYKTLSNPDATMSYILKLHALLEDEEKYSLPPGFLMEMMDLNEVVSDYEMEPGNEALKQQAASQLQEHLREWRDAVAPLTGKFDAGDHSEALLLQIKDHYFRKKYLLRIQHRLQTLATNH